MRTSARRRIVVSVAPVGNDISPPSINPHGIPRMGRGMQLKTEGKKMTKFITRKKDTLYGETRSQT
jgi:hypothetical protein